MTRQYIKPEVTVHKLSTTMLMTGSASGCNCGCPRSDVYPGACGCNNGRGCPGCGADHGGGIVGNNFTRKVNSVEDDIFDQ